MAPFRFLLLFSLLFCNTAFAQLRGIVQDAQTGRGIPFASLRLSPGNSGTVADLMGNFSLETTDAKAIEISSVGYEARRISLPISQSPVLIKLYPAKEAELKEVTIGSPVKKIRRLLNAAIAARDKHNPEKRPEYQCRVYYKMIADATFDALADDSATREKIKHFEQTQHLLIAETYSIRSFRRPASLQEDITATRFSGLSSPAFTNLVTDILPFQIQSDFIRLGQTDYPNPIAKGYETRYDFRLLEELQNGPDTVWILAYKPKKTVRGLQGQISLHSNGYVAAQMIAEARDTALRQSTRIDIQYAQTAGQWFPDKLNYKMEWRQFMGKKQDVFISGSSRIDSISFALPPRFRFDKAHTSRLAPDAVKNNDSQWTAIRPEPLSDKDTQTYHVIDSFSNSLPTDNIVRFASALPQGKLPIKKLDLNLDRVVSFNDYEGYRFGLGLQTSYKISKKYTAGLWAGYGQVDKRWKYGAFAEVYLDKFQEQVIHFSYDRDLRDPGRVFLHPDLETGSYIRQYLIQRADLSEKALLQFRNRMGFLSTELDFSLERIQPLYSYRFRPFADSNVTLQVREITLRARYAFGEKRAYNFGTYTPIDTRYPILYLSATGGLLRPDNAEGDKLQNQYLQLLGGVELRKHLNRIGQERLLILAGKDFSQSPLPVSRLFAGRGFRLAQGAAFNFGNFYTLRPYDMYNDQFVSLHFRHLFDFHFYKTRFSYPSLSLGYNAIWGSLSRSELHEGVRFRDASGGYQEAGFALHDVLRFRFFGVAYAGLQLGYYVPLMGKQSLQDGVAVVGISFGL